MTRFRPALAALALAPFLADAAVVRPRRVLSNPGAFPDATAAEASKKYDEAVAGSKWDEAVVALVTKIRMQYGKGDSGEGDILRELDKAAAAAPEPIRAPLRAILANAYRAYYDNHRWELRGRTAGASGEKLEGWDGPRLLREIDARYAAALAEVNRLSGTPIAAYAAITYGGDAASDRRRPTLYDFLAYDAFAYYTAPARGEIVPSDAISTGPDSPLLGATTEFLAWRPEGDAADPVARAAAILRQLHALHAGETEARTEVELTRWRWARVATTGDVADRRIREGLTQLAASAPASTAGEVYAELAGMLRERNEPNAARAAADKGRKAAAPGSPGAAMCENIVREIEAPEASLRAERVWNSPWPRLGIVHKNLSKIHLRAVRWDWKDFLGANRGRPEWLSEAEKKSVMAAAPVKTWSVDLPATPDYKLRTDRFAVPEDLPPGFYFLLASPDEDFSPNNNRVFYTDFWVSRLAVVADGAPGGKVSGRVLDATTGEPVPGAAVSGWYLANSRDRSPVSDTVTDATGAFTLEPPKHRGLLILAKTTDGRELGSMQEFSGGYDTPAQKAHNRVTFFPDRAIYRPGQTLKFKGVVIRTEPEKNDARPITDRRVTVALDDPNGKEVARIVCLSNGYGAFDGVFETPRDRLPGTYAIHTVGSENGRGYVQVEEYKRPTFEVKLTKSPTPDSRAATVTLSARTYTDAPVDGAKVTWRVVRRADWPRWCWWFPGEPETEVASGDGKLRADGTFVIDFPAPAPSRERRGASPVYTYSVTAQVTDVSGETRSGETAVLVGKTDRTAEVVALDEPGVFKVSVSTLDGTPVAGVSGTLVVKRMEEPAYVHRAPLESENEFRGQRHLRRLAKYASDGVHDDIGVYDGDDESGIRKELVDLSDPRNWAVGATVATLPFATDNHGVTTLTAAGLKPGHYRVFVETKDAAGRPVTARENARVLPSGGDTLGLKVPFVLEADTDRLYKPGETFVAKWGTGYETGRAFVEIFRRDKPVESYWTEPGKTFREIRIPITDADVGGFSVAVSQVRENRFYRDEAVVSVPKPDKALKLSWEHFTDKLTPGAKETWTAVVRRKDGDPLRAEVVATLYDASLDAYSKLNWAGDFGLWNRYTPTHNPGFLNLEKGFRWVYGEWGSEMLPVELHQRGWNAELNFQNYGNAVFARTGKGGIMGGAVMEMRAAPFPKASSFSADAAPAPASAPGDMPPAPKTPSLDAVSPRRNLEESAFFIPRLETGDDGKARFEFTVPESLTRWRFLAFAHDKALRTGLLEATAVTALDLMVKPNPPRFLREGDVMEIPVKLINKTDKPVSGTARLNLSDANTGKPLEAALLGDVSADRKFTIPANGSVAVFWKVTVPEGCPFVNYAVKAVSESGKSDGEAGWLPVLARRIPVTESRAAALVGPGEVRVKLDNLATSGASSTLRSTSLRVDTVARPAWYAVMALPYLMEYPHECSEQLFHRYYANALAAQIARSNPGFRETFKRWQGTAALDSPLEKNADIKGLALEETPWVREAAGENQQRRQVALLFDEARLKVESAASLRKLAERRLPDGGWGWFPGGVSSPWVTRTVVLGLGRLREAGAPVDINFVLPSIPVLDRELAVAFSEIKKHKDYENGDYLSSETAHTLQARAYFLKDAPVSPESKDAYDFFLTQAKNHWDKLDRASQARLALALPTFGDNDTPASIVKSLRERSVSDGDKGMRWNDAPAAGWWRPWVAPIETQALMVEVFETVAKDPAAADACRLALLANKRTNAWPTTTGTAEACYALLMRGSDWTTSGEPLAVSVGGAALTPVAVEPGIGATSVSVPAAQIRPASADILVKKTEAGPAWVAVHWSYLEDAGKVKASEQSALTLKKTLWKKIITKAGPELVSLEGRKVEVGDELVVRLEVTADRDLDFVHIKDTRPSCVEPGVALSGYRWNGGLGYYETVRDTATHRFVEHLPKGTHVFEFSARAAQRGVCGAGLSEVRCMYAPEFAAHAGAPVVTVE